MKKWTYILALSFLGNIACSQRALSDTNPISLDTLNSWNQVNAEEFKTNIQKNYGFTLSYETSNNGLNTISFENTNKETIVKSIFKAEKTLYSLMYTTKDKTKIENWSSELEKRHYQKSNSALLDGNSVTYFIPKSTTENLQIKTEYAVSYNKQNAQYLFYINQ